MEATMNGASSLSPARRARIYVMEARAQFLTVARTPAFMIPTLVFPLMFYVFFGVVMRFSLTAPTYLLATYGVFGIIGPSLFGFGVGLANERESGALLLKQTTPLPAGAYLLARMVSALLFGAVIVLGLFLLGAYAAGVTLYRWQWVLAGGGGAGQRDSVLRPRPGDRRLGEGAGGGGHRQSRLPPDGLSVRAVVADLAVARRSCRTWPSSFRPITRRSSR